MSQRRERFEVDGTPRVFLRLPAGKARVISGEEGIVEVRMSGRESAVARFLVEARGGEIVIEPEGGRIGRWSGVDVEIRVGSGADLHARLASGDVAVETPIGGLAVDAGSGDVTTGVVSGDARIKTASGDIDVREVTGRLDVAAASGDVRVGAVRGDVTAKAASGDIEIGQIDGSLVAHAASGDIDVGRFAGDLFQAKTLSGDVRFGLAPGAAFSVEFNSLSGDIRTDFPVGIGESTATARLAVKTMSGDIIVRSVV